MRLLIGALLLALFAAPAGAATLPRCGRLIDVRAGRVLTNTTIFVDGTTIVRVEQAALTL